MKKHLFVLAVGLLMGLPLRADVTAGGASTQSNSGSGSGSVNSLSSSIEKSDAASAHTQMSTAPTSDEKVLKEHLAREEAAARAAALIRAESSKPVLTGGNGNDKNAKDGDDGLFGGVTGTLRRWTQSDKSGSPGPGRNLNPAADDSPPPPTTVLIHQSDSERGSSNDNRSRSRGPSESESLKAFFDEVKPWLFGAAGLALLGYLVSLTFGYVRWKGKRAKGSGVVGRRGGRR
jgi:hypothetical protein